MAKHTVELQSGDKVTYWSHNDSRKQTLVLIHGFTGTHEGFQYLVPLLSDFRLIIPDLPGFGVSPLPHHKLTLAELGKLLTQFIQKLELEKPNLIGHSMGSLVVAEAIRQHPELFAKELVLASPVPTPIKWIDSRKVGAVASGLYYSASHRLPVVGKRLSTSKPITKFSTNLIMTTKDVEMRDKIHRHHYDNLNYISHIGWYKQLNRQINRTGISHYKSALSKFDVLIINGDNDAVTPLKHQKKTADIINAKLITIPEVGHLAHYEKPTDLAAAIVDFLR
mgnify:CR=1 FL=1